MFCVPAHLQRLFAHWDALQDSGAARRTCPRSGWWPTPVLPCPEWVEAAPGRGVPRRVDLGVLRLDRGAVHRLPQRGVARAPGHARAVPDPGGPCRSTTSGRLWCVVPEHARFSYLGDPREDRRGVAGHPERSGLHRRRPRPRRRRRLRPPRRPTRGPRDQRRRQRLPGRGRARARRARRGRGRRRLRPRRRALGPAGLRGRGRAGRRGPRSTSYAREHLAPPSGPRSGTGSTRCRAPRPARCAASTCPTWWTVA